MELLLGDIYIEKKDYKQAETYYTSASFMCPNRFWPLYPLYELYKTTGNVEKTSVTAKILLEKPAKVNFALIRKIYIDSTNQFFVSPVNHICLSVRGIVCR